MRFKDLILICERNMVLEYTEKYVQQQVNRLKPLAGPFVDEQVIVDRINKFDRLKSGGTQRDLIRLAKQAVQAGRIPETARTTIAFAPEVSPGIASLLNIDPVKLSPKQRNLINYYNSELQRLKKIEVNPLEINFYSWKNLEDVIDQFPPDEEEPTISVGEGELNNKVYDKDGLEIYYLPDKFISYKTKNYILDRLDKEGKTRQGDNKLYNWCISYLPERSLFKSYRMTRKVPAGHAIYMVYDTKAPTTSPWHYFIVQVSNTGKGPYGSEGPYYVTDATNGQERYYSWNELIEKAPRIAPAKNALKPVPYTMIEKSEQLLANATAQNFAKLPYKLKIAYIETCFNNNKKILQKDYGELDSTLQHLYINNFIASLGQVSPTSALYELLRPFNDSYYYGEPIDADFKETLQIAKKLKQKDVLDKNADLLGQNVTKNSPIKTLSRKAKTFNRYKDVMGDYLQKVLQSRLSTGVRI